MGTYAITSGGLQTANLVRLYFPASAWVTFVAIADAESTFNPLAVNAASGAAGLFQIEYWLHGLTRAQALNAVFNTQTAAKMYAQSGLTPWAGDGYQQYLGIAQTLINKTAPVSAPPPQAAAVPVIAATFGVSGSASVTPGGRINGTLRLTAQHGTVDYKVTMWVTPTYNTTDPTSTTTTGSATNTTVDVNQSLLAPLPSPEIIRSYQQIHSGPVQFTYTVNWTVSDASGSRTVTGGQRVTLTVQ